MRGYMQWVLRPGESIERTALHNDFGGGRQGGISPSRQTQAKPLYSDLYVAGVLLVEAKGTIERGAVRMALGQLLDYGRFVPKEVRRAVLLPSEPRRDVLALIRPTRSGGTKGLSTKTGQTWTSRRMRF
jgi:hypothetical protein